MNKYTLALSTIKMTKRKEILSNKTGLTTDFTFESSYCLYRLERFPAALKIIQESKISNNRIELLKAQILYRLERFEESAEIFQKLLQSNQCPSQELQVNLLAAMSQARINFDLEFFNQNEHSFEISYNLALLKYFSKNFKAAGKYADNCDYFACNEDTSPSDLINAQLVSICSLMSDKYNWPEAECLLRKLKSRNE